VVEIASRAEGTDRGRESTGSRKTRSKRQQGWQETGPLGIQTSAQPGS
jgi:hypothetical protein